MNILVCDPVSPKGIALLQKRPEFNVTVLKQKLTEAELGAFHCVAKRDGAAGGGLAVFEIHPA